MRAEQVVRVLLSAAGVVCGWIIVGWGGLCVDYHHISASLQGIATAFHKNGPKTAKDIDVVTHIYNSIVTLATSYYTDQ